MDNKTLKAFIVKSKDEGLTYQEIADKLEEEYKIVRSRQALQGMYQRAVRDKDTTLQKERFVASADIVNVYCLGYNKTEVTDIVNKLGFNLSYNDVVSTIREQEDYIKNVEESIIAKVEREMSTCHFINELSPRITYKGILPTDKQLKRYVAEAYKDILSREFAERLMNIYEFTDDKSVPKKVEEELRSMPLKFSNKLW